VNGNGGVTTDVSAIRLSGRSGHPLFTIYTGGTLRRFGRPSAFVKTSPCVPALYLAPLFMQCLGIDPDRLIHDRAGRDHSGGSRWQRQFVNFLI